MFLNEAFISEKDSSKTSKYSVVVNGHEKGRFKSSGIIASTGTGSSGWLYGAKRMTSFNVHDIIETLKTESQSSQENMERINQSSETLYLEDELANQISSETHFKADCDKIYYYVREPNESTNNEGFCTKLELESELNDG